MHVVVSSSPDVFHNCIISFVILCCGFLIVPGVWSLHVFLTGPLFALFSMHFIALVIVCHLVCFSASP